jgi:hypothetical protein
MKMQKDIFESAIRPKGKLAGVFEYDGDTGYFYLYDIRDDDNHRILESIHILTGDCDFDESDVSVQWDTEQKRVGLFLRGKQWAVFNVKTQEAHGGGYKIGAVPDIPVGDRFSMDED